MYAQNLQVKITQAEGLSSYNVRSVIKDPLGSIWICTQDGLSRYNGSSCTNYTIGQSNANHRIDFTDCRSIYVDSVRQQLWVLGTVGGLNVINYVTGCVQERYIRRAASSDEWYVTFKKVDNELWIGTTKGLLIFSIINKIFTSVHLPFSSPQQPFHRINTIDQDHYGNMWVYVNEEGLYVLSSKTHQIICMKSKQVFDLGYPAFDFLSSALVGDTVFTGTSVGLSIFVFNSSYRFIKIPLPKKIKQNCTDNAIHHIGWRNHQLFVCGKKFLTFRSDFSNCTILSETCNDLWLTEINNIYFLSDNLMVLGCNSGVAILNLFPVAIERTSNTDRLYKGKLKHVFALYPTGDNATLCATSNGLYEVSASGVIHTIDETQMYQNISAVSKVEWIASNKNGLVVIKKHKKAPIASLYPEFNQYRHWQVNSCACLNDSLFILGTENYKGILIWNKTAHTIQNIRASAATSQLLSDNVNTVFLDDRSRIWVLSDFSIAVIDYFTGKAQHIVLHQETNNEPLGFYFDVAQVGKEFWVAVYGKGILVLDEHLKAKRIIDEKGGLCNNGVYKIYSIGSYVFVSSNNGVSQIDRYTAKIKNYYYPVDGLRGNSFEEACGAIKNGIIYLGGLDGFSVINSKLINFNPTPPELHFQNIEVETANSKLDTLDAFIKKLIIPNDYIQVKVSFAGIIYENPEKVKYWYRLDPSGQEWLPLGSQNFVSLIRTRPGNYLLEVKAANEDGVESVPIQLILIFQPHWYETIWFKLLLVAVLASIFYALYRYRLSQLKAREAIRTQIASDLHDDIGSTLTSVRILTDLAMLYNPGLYLPQIKQGIQDTIAATRDIIWVMDKSRSSAAHLLEKIKGFAMPLTSASHIQLNIYEDERLDQIELEPEERRDLYLIAKEFIANSLKYSNCTTIDFQMSVKAKSLCINILDNGNGFDLNTVKRGNGINNMLQRAEAIKYKTSFNSAADSGTSLTLYK